jgi:lipoprotein-anchoring transpeptidase ErfK/SrfK
LIVERLSFHHQQSTFHNPHSFLLENMEVLMSRTRRMSRWLIAATAIVLALGLIFWFGKFAKRSNPVAAASTQPAHAPLLVASAVASANPAPLVVSAAPTTAPAPLSALPATQPTPTAAPLAQPLVMFTPGVAGATTPSVQLASALEPPKPAPAVHTVGASINENGPAPAGGTPLSTQPLVDAQAKLAQNNSLDARRILNTALLAGKMSPADTAKAKELLSTISATVVFSGQHFDNDEYGGIYAVKPGDRLQKIATEHDVTWELLCRINGLSDPRKLRSGNHIKLIKGPFCAVVSKKNFTLDLYLGSPSEKSAMFVTSFPVGLGKDDSTPKGTWMVEPHNKIKKPTYYSPRGEGVIAADDPANPLGGYWIGLTGIDGQAVGKKSYGIHGTIHPESVGKMESMGCIRLKKEDITQVFDMLVEGKSTVMVTD